MSDRTEDAGTPSDYSCRRWWLEIVSWDLSLMVRMSTSTPTEYRFQGGLDYTRSLVLQCRVVNEGPFRGRQLGVWVSPFGPEMTFGPSEDDLHDVGAIDLRPRDPDRMNARLMIPAEAHALLATALASRTKYVLLETFDATPELEKVFGFLFSDALPEYLTSEVRG